MLPLPSDRGPGRGVRTTGLCRYQRAARVAGAPPFATPPLSGSDAGLTGALFEPRHTLREARPMGDTAAVADSG